ncbi:MAG: amidohydrolase family protein [Promethearchaeota archaeon]
MEGETVKQIRCRGAFIGEEMEYIEDVSIHVEAGKIIAVEEDRSTHFDSPYMAFPSFINAHTHVGDSFMKDSAFNKTLSEIVAPPRGIKHRMLESEPVASITGGIVDSIREMVRYGTGTFMDFREGGIGGFNLLDNAIDGITPPVDARILARPLASLSSIKSTLDRLGDRSNFAGFNISSPNGWTDDLLCEFHDRLSSRDDLLFATHVAETPKNPVKSMNVHGMTDAGRMEHFFGDVSHRTVLVHCNHLTSDDVETVLDSVFSIVFCPRVASLFHNLNVRDAPYKRLIEGGINCCLGTDNVMLNSPDLFQELNFFTRILKAFYKDWSFEPEDIIKMVTINPARALHVDARVGSITKGKDASICLLDLNSVTLKNSRDLPVSFIIRATSRDIAQQFHRGREVMCGGHES